MIYVPNPAASPIISIPLPDDGSPRTAASVNVPFEALADNVASLNAGIANAPTIVARPPKLFNSNCDPSYSGWTIHPQNAYGDNAGDIPYLLAPLSIGGGLTGRPVVLDLSPLPHGASLVDVVAYFTAQPSRAALPQVYPTLNVVRVQTTPSFNTNPYLPPGAGVTPFGSAWTQSLNSAGGATYPTPANLAAYVNGGNLNAIVCVCNQNEVIDLTRYYYLAILIDESGTGASGGNAYPFIAVSWTYKQSPAQGGW